MRERWVILAAVAAVAFEVGAVGWRNLDADHHICGRKASEGYLKGKVVLVDRWGAKCPPCRAMLPQVEQIWQSFKTKQFVVLGGHCRGWGSPDEVKRVAEGAGVTYPVYEDAGLAEGEPQFDGIPFLYVVDETGRVVYKGRNERNATQAIVTALTDMDAPRDVRQWKRFLDFEIAELPGRGLQREAEGQEGQVRQDARRRDRQVLPAEGIRRPAGRAGGEERDRRPRVDTGLALRTWKWTWRT